MDGNRRWAAARGLSANKGHEAGADTLEEIVKAATDFGIKYLTVFALSTDNLKERSNLEISFLFSLMEKVFREKLSTLNENGVQLKIIGNITSLPSRIRSFAREAERAVPKNTRLFLIVAFNYGSREEIVSAVRKLTKKASAVQEEDISNHLYTAGIPDPDLIIRTGGQKRLSNFLLWQGAYAELYFTETFWPDFVKEELKEAIEDYRKRKRNFGR